MGMFFGITSDPTFHGNQERLRLLSKKTVTHEDQAEVIEQEVARRNVVKDKVVDKPVQPGLL
jgi:hypothetical protein